MPRQEIGASYRAFDFTFSIPRELRPAFMLR
jgi:hypothetical protein